MHSLVTHCTHCTALTHSLTDDHSLPQGRYYLYGEHYGNTNGMGKDLPKIGVYSSATMESGTWVNHGHLDELGNWTWPTKPHGTFFTPWAVVHPKTNKVLFTRRAMHGEHRQHCSVVAAFG